jgi:CBS domain-containing protein
MKALDVMQRQVVTVTAEASIKDAVHLMTAHRISGLPVVDVHGSVVGILSEGDLLRRVELGTELRLPVWRAWFADAGRIAADYVRSHGRKVGEVMTVPAICVTPETELSEVVALMESRRIKRVPVIRDGLLAGIVTRSDLIRALGQLLPKADTRPAADAELRPEQPSHS